MRDALALIRDAAPNLAVDGEMHGDAALAKQVLDRVFPGSELAANVNPLIMPNFAANISYNLLRVAASDGVTVGPILLGAGKPVHILTQTATVRGILNMTALAAVDATQINAGGDDETGCDVTEGRLIRSIFTAVGDVYARNFARSMPGLLGRHDGRYQGAGRATCSVITGICCFTC
jgi:hypothetical protein